MCKDSKIVLLYCNPERDFYSRKSNKCEIKKLRE